jgi:hypothetical protein
MSMQIRLEWIFLLFPPSYALCMWMAAIVISFPYSYLIIFAVPQHENQSKYHFVCLVTSHRSAMYIVIFLYVGKQLWNRVFSK